MQLTAPKDSTKSFFGPPSSADFFYKDYAYYPLHRKNYLDTFWPCELTFIIF